MTITVSVTDLRNNISDYLDRVAKGTRLLVRDEKKKKTIAQITQTHIFNKDSYEKALRKAAGIFTAKNHPEWRTEKDVRNWLIKSRLSSDRKL